MKLIFKALFIAFVIAIGAFCYNTQHRVDEAEAKLQCNCEVYKKKIESLETKVEYDAKVIAELESKFEENKKAFEIQNARIVLLGILFNENFSRIGSDFIFLEWNWKIREFPRSLIWTRTDNQYLIEKHLDKEAKIKDQKKCVPPVAPAYDR